MLKSLDCNSEFVEAIASLLGQRSVPLGTAFNCVLHEEEHASAAFLKAPSGHWYYKDFHAGKHDDPTELALASLYAAWITGRVGKLAKGQHVMWKLRLLVDIGWVMPAHVPLPPLPAFATKKTANVYEGIVFAFACHNLYSPGSPMPLTWRFLEDWCGVAQGTAKNALQFLCAQNVVAKVGVTDTKNRFGTVTALYQPGTLPPPLPAAPLIRETDRAFLATVAKAMADTRRRKKYWRLRECAAEFEQYIPGITKERGLKKLRAMIIARLTASGQWDAGGNGYAPSQLQAVSDTSDGCDQLFISS